MQQEYRNESKRMMISATIDFAIQHYGCSYQEALITTASTIQSYPTHSDDYVELERIFSMSAICFFDYYKKLVWKQNKHRMSYMDMYAYQCLLKVDNMLDLLHLWKNNLGCFLNAIDACYWFHKKSYSSKSDLLNSLSPSEHQYLNAIYPTHIEDQKLYTKVKCEDRIGSNKQEKNY